jgi:hypothetical protein
MPFTGLSSNERFTATQVQEDVAAAVAALSPKETAILDWLGDSDVFATSTKHEYWVDYMPPNKIVASTAVNSATAVTPFQTNGFGLALTVGTLLENQSAAPEVVQVVSIVGANSIVVSRNYGGAGIGSLAAGGEFYVRGYAGVEGQDHTGSSVRRLGTRLQNTVGLFRAEIAMSGTDMALDLYGNDSYGSTQGKALRQLLWGMENEVLRGVWNSTNSLGTFSASTGAGETRTMQGLRGFITTINSTVVASSFAAATHTYLGDAFANIFDQGGSPTETWAIIAGANRYRDISNLNDTKVQDSNEREVFKRVIRRYTGPFGTAEVLLGRALDTNEALIVPRERIKVVPLQGRSFSVEEMAKSGDNRKSLITGEYTIEVHHANAMARIK